MHSICASALTPSSRRCAKTRAGALDEAKTALVHSSELQLTLTKHPSSGSTMDNLEHSRSDTTAGSK